MKLYVTNNKTIDFIQFKNIKIALDMDVYIFFGNIDENNNIKMYKYVKEKLLKKFKVDRWDSLDYNKNLFHIKFLVKYSPILSKFINVSEFNTIELASSNDRIANNWRNISYINLNDGKEFFNVYDASYTERDVISLEIDSEFLKILKEGNHS